MVKTVGTAHYVHKSNVIELVDKYVLDKDKSKLKMLLYLVDKIGLNYDIIKYDKGNLTLISSPDWNTANEPIVGTCYRWKADNWFKEFGVLNEPKKSENYKQIYHNKWMFVSDTYAGFDLEDAKQRSKLWNSLPDIKEVKSKIGYKSFWESYLRKYNIGL